MEKTPKANRIHIGFFGRCNAGKSTLINMLTDQPVSLVSDVAGTTTDPVSKAMEILPLGPVVITDTAGIDDTTELGTLRMEKTEEVLKKINLAVYVLRTDEEPTSDDMHWLGLLKQNNVPIALFINEINSTKFDKHLYKNDIDELKATVRSRTASTTSPAARPWCSKTCSPGPQMKLGILVKQGKKDQALSELKHLVMGYLNIVQGRKTETPIYFDKLEWNESTSPKRGYLLENLLWLLETEDVYAELRAEDVYREMVEKIQKELEKIR